MSYKLKIKDIIYHMNTYKLLVEYPPEPISPAYAFTIYNEQEEVIQLSGLKPAQDIPASAKTGIVLETNVNLSSLMHYNPRRQNLWLERYKRQSNGQSRFLYDEQEEKQKQEAESKKKSFFVEERPSKI